MSSIAAVIVMLTLAWPVSVALTADRLAESWVTLATAHAHQPPTGTERPHLRPRPAPDRFFDLAPNAPAGDPQPDGKR